MAEKLPIYPWVFRQLGGDKKVFSLRGWCAPFGRPRHKAVVEDEIVMHENTVRYPDSQGSVTRHVFGPSFSDWELTGRFLDRELGRVGGQSGANVLADSIKAFVRDGQPVEVQWGDHVHVKGFIKKFKIKREGAGYIEWVMSIMVDADLRADITKGQAPITFNPQTKLRQLAGYFLVLDSYTKQGKNPFGFIASALDHIDNAISKVTGAIGMINTAVGDLKDLKKATFGQISRLRQGLLQAKSAVTGFMTLIQTTRDDALVFAEQVRNDPDRVKGSISDSADRFSVGASANQDLEIRAWTSQAQVNMQHMLAILAQLDREAELAEQGQARTVYTARQGDSWERIALQKLGSASKADLIRQRNKIRYGAPPVPGRRYVIPLAS